MKSFWTRLSAKTRKRVICAAFYVVWIVVTWFLGKKHLMTPADAFFGLAALTAFYAAVYLVITEKLIKQPKQ